MLLPGAELQSKELVVLVGVPASEFRSIDHSSEEPFIVQIFGFHGAPLGCVFQIFLSKGHMMMSLMMSWS